jgi:hypothetical protein
MLCCESGYLAEFIVNNRRRAENAPFANDIGRIRDIPA